LVESEFPQAKELRNAVALFFLTLVTVYFTYGWLWSPGSPLKDGQTIQDSAVFAVALMSILAAHELAHYWVARRHGFELSLPYFIPFPMAFGTLGAVIRLRSLPKSRTALLEMGAAGPLAGAFLAFIFIAIGLQGTVPYDAPPVVENGVDVLIFGNPAIMDHLGALILGEAPGRYDGLTPLALAGWVGCFLTALNLLPVGQLDGGHIVTSLSPRWAPLFSKLTLGILFAAGFFFWEGWAVWAVLLLLMGAWENLEVPVEPALSKRARWIAVCTALFMGLCFMVRPLETETLAHLPKKSVEISP
jgi:membrane-associated protease RseP (regulator of RpoE activity)